MMTLYSVCLRSPSASSFSRAVSTLNPCCEKYSLIEKQMDSSSSTTSKFLELALGRSLTVFCSRLRKNSLRRPETLFSISMKSSFQLLPQTFAKTSRYTNQVCSQSSKVAVQDRFRNPIALTIGVDLQCAAIRKGPCVIHTVGGCEEFRERGGCIALIVSREQSPALTNSLPGGGGRAVEQPSSNAFTN